MVAFALSAGLAGVAAASAPADVLSSPRVWAGTEISPLDASTAVPSVSPPPGFGGSSYSSSSASPPAATSRSSPARAGTGTRPRLDQVLSNETTATRWAYVARLAPIYKRPTPASARVARLHWFTEDSFPEVYLVLRAHWDQHGQEWVQVRIPMRPNGRTGWVRRQDLDSFQLTHTLIVVNRERLRLYVFRQGRLIWSAPIAVGKPSTPTPAGHFWIREAFAIDDPQSGYWPYAFGTSDYSTLTDWPGGGVVGIHGPYYQPQDIPGQVSHGCIRLQTSDDAWLAQHAGVGTPLEIL